MYQIRWMGEGRGSSVDLEKVRLEERRVRREPGRVASSWVYDRFLACGRWTGLSLESGETSEGLGYISAPFAAS